MYSFGNNHSHQSCTQQKKHNGKGRLGLASLLLVGKHFLNVKKGIEGTGDLKSNSVKQLETVF